MFKKQKKQKTKKKKKKKTPYICNVFFIVLDLRLSKGWVKALTLFLCPFVSAAQSVIVLHSFRLASALDLSCNDLKRVFQGCSGSICQRQMASIL